MIYLSEIERTEGVLIESDWNLKHAASHAATLIGLVLIESDWNLKSTTPLRVCVIASVLIESDWNLKRDLSR